MTGDGPRYPPPGWDSSDLSTFIDQSHENRWATFVGFSKECDELAELNAALDEFWSGLRDPRSTVVAQLLARASLLFKSAAELALATQWYSAIVIARAAIESSAYAGMISLKPELEPVWMKRNESAARKKESIASFSMREIRFSLETYHPELAISYTQLYENFIDFGAHPNVAGISLGSSIRAHPEGSLIEQAGLTDDRELIGFGLKAAKEVGLFVGGVITHVFHEQPAAQKFAARILKTLSDEAGPPPD